MRLALYQPDIPQNAGASLRLAACFGLNVDIIEPCGFVWSNTRMRRAGMDYIDAVSVTRHPNYDAFRSSLPGRVILLTTKGDTPYTDHVFEAEDTLLLGRESAGVPESVHEAADHRVIIPLRNGMRSLNVVNAAAMVVGEALRQQNAFPSLE